MIPKSVLIGLGEWDPNVQEERLRKGPKRGGGGCRYLDPVGEFGREVLQMLKRGPVLRRSPESWVGLSEFHGGSRRGGGWDGRWGDDSWSRS